MTTGRGPRSLQDLIEDIGGDLVGHFYNDTAAPHLSRSAGAAVHVPPVFTNWRDEQRAWRESAVLFDQSHHMPELFVSGPDAVRLLERVGVNSPAGFRPGRARQFVGCAPSGHLIGECILYCLPDGSFELVSGATLLDWVQYQAQSQRLDVTIRRDNATLDNPSGRRVRYRFQLDGPFAARILADAVDGEVPGLGFFRTAEVRIGGHDVLLLRHGMAGHQGVELSGPFDELDAVRALLLAAGAEHGLLQGGTRTYFSTVLESGWIGYPVPAIYTGEQLRGFRQWLDGSGWQARTQLGGSYVAQRIEDYYLNPYELGYGKLVSFDHEFIGADALRAMTPERGRRRITLVWNREDVSRIWAAQLGDGPRLKSLELPVASYGFPQHDEVRDSTGRLVGVSMGCGYSNNEGEVLSLAIVDSAAAQPGNELLVTWGEPGGGSRKPHVERHEQTTVRVTTAPVPYARPVREHQHDSLSARHEHPGQLARHP